MEVLSKRVHPAEGGEAAWEEFTGTEAIVAVAGYITDGQNVIGK